LRDNLLMVDVQQSMRLRSKVREAYSAAAEDPRASHPFPVGRRFAESVGYPGDLLDRMPPVCVDAFAGVSNVALFADLQPGATVLDLGCGAGLDSLIAAERIGPDGMVLGLDFSESMLLRARQARSQSGRDNALFCRGDAENLPLEDKSIDAALANGIFNLNPARAAIFPELARVLRPGGAVYVAEIILRQPLPPEVRSSEVDWFA
jgi:arsenite methyltransferase